jgi:hypothetical protein
MIEGELGHDQDEPAGGDLELDLLDEAGSSWSSALRASSAARRSERSTTRAEDAGSTSAASMPRASARPSARSVQVAPTHVSSAMARSAAGGRRRRR